MTSKQYPCTVSHFSQAYLSPLARLQVPDLSCRTRSLSAILLCRPRRSHSIEEHTCWSNSSSLSSLLLQQAIGWHLCSSRLLKQRADQFQNISQPVSARQWFFFDLLQDFSFLFSSEANSMVFRFWLHVYSCNSHTGSRMCYVQRHLNDLQYYYL